MEGSPSDVLAWTHHAILPETRAALDQILAMDWEGSQSEAIEAGREHNARVMARDEQKAPEKPAGVKRAKAGAKMWG